jgi:hypothetical protein
MGIQYLVLVNVHHTGHWIIAYSGDSGHFDMRTASIRDKVFAAASAVAVTAVDGRRFVREGITGPERAVRGKGRERNGRCGWIRRVARAARRARTRTLGSAMAPRGRAMAVELRDGERGRRASGQHGDSFVGARCRCGCVRLLMCVRC